MKQTKEFKDFIEAIDSLVSGNPIDNLEDLIKSIGHNYGSAEDFREICYLIIYVRQKNRLLQGEDPIDVYGGQDYEGYIKEGQKALEEALTKYK